VAAPPSADAPEIRQQIQVLSLGGVLIPAAADPVGAEGFSDGERLDLRLNRDTSSLLAPDDLAPGDLFRIVSAQPRSHPTCCVPRRRSRHPTRSSPSCPTSSPTSSSELAREVTAGTTNSYDAAMALQNWFRDPNEFSYSLEVQSGHGTNAIESFFNERVGYCEQFAATFATMATHARDPVPGRRRIHAWGAQRRGLVQRDREERPRVARALVRRIGWVPFEPTPGRGAPGAESYTGVPRPRTRAGRTAPVLRQGQPSRRCPRRPRRWFLRRRPFRPAASTATTVPGGPNIPSDGGLTDFDGDDAFPAASSNGGPPRTVLLAGLAVLAVAGRRSLAGSGSAASVGRSRPPGPRGVGSCDPGRHPGRRDRPRLDDRPRVGVGHRLGAAGRRTPDVRVGRRGRPGDVRPPDAVDLERHGAYGTTLGHDCELWADQIARIATDTLSGPQRVRRYFTTWS
jgi:transglutaminase-like putative cysteine protease